MLSAHLSSGALEGAPLIVVVDAAEHLELVPLPDTDQLGLHAGEVEADQGPEEEEEQQHSLIFLSPGLFLVQAQKICKQR